MYGSTIDKENGFTIVEVITENDEVIGYALLDPAGKQIDEYKTIAAARSALNDYIDKYDSPGPGE